MTRLELATFSLGSGESSSEGRVLATTCDGGGGAGCNWDALASDGGVSDALLRPLVDALEELPPDERAAVLDHVARLVKLPLARRVALMAALFALADG